VQLSPRALGALALCQWTGNVRELANLIERLSIVCAGRTVEVRDLPPKYRPPLDWTLEIKALDPTSMAAMAQAAMAEAGMAQPGMAQAGMAQAIPEVEHLTDETALSVLEEVE